MPTGYVFDHRFLDHDTGPGHPERPERLRAIEDELGTSGLADLLVHLPVQPAEMAWIERIHERAYLQRLQQACARGLPYIDAPDSAICSASFEIALLAAGGVLGAVDAVMAGEVHNAFCAVRPPGHHAEADRSMGFCLLNHVAIAAEYLRVKHGLARIAIMDFDVHHGNGSQHLFEHRADILFISVHEDPRHLYPGTGFETEIGRAQGEGFTVNVAMPPGSGDRAYQAAFEAEVMPNLASFGPQFLLVSAGFDAAASDPLASQRVTADGFEWIAHQLKDASEDLCDGRLVAVLEGGYHLRALSQAVARFIRVLLEAPPHRPG